MVDLSLKGFYVYCGEKLHSINVLYLAKLQPAHLLFADKLD